MKEFLGQLGTFRLLLLLACIPLAIAAYIYKFVIPGYSFTALVCTGLIALCLFYALMPLAAPCHPQFVRWTVRIVSTLLIFGLLAFSITEAIIIKASFGTPRRAADYVVVLGAKVNENGPSISLWDRISAAYDYLQAHPQAIAVVSGGQGPDEPMSEAQCMYDHLVQWGIDPSRILMEDRATNTRENLLFSLDLLEEHTGQRPTELGVLSSEYHLFRAGLVAKACDVDFIGIPARTARLSQKINYFMREVPGVWYYILLGGQYS